MNTINTDFVKQKWQYKEDTDCTVCFKESHCKALAKAEREGK